MKRFGSRLSSPEEIARNLHPLDRHSADLVLVTVGFKPPIRPPFEREQAASASTRTTEDAGDSITTPGFRFFQITGTFKGEAARIEPRRLVLAESIRLPRHKSDLRTRELQLEFANNNSFPSIHIGRIAIYDWKNERFGKGNLKPIEPQEDYFLSDRAGHFLAVEGILRHLSGRDEVERSQARQYQDMVSDTQMLVTEHYKAIQDYYRGVFDPTSFDS